MNVFNKDIYLKMFLKVLFNHLLSDDTSNIREPTSIII